MPMKHYRKDERVQSLMIEFNRWPYLGEDYSVDSERVEVLIEILRRVAEVLKENKFLVCRTTSKDRITTG